MSQQLPVWVVTDGANGGIGDTVKDSLTELRGNISKVPQPSHPSLLFSPGVPRLYNSLCFVSETRVSERLGYWAKVTQMGRALRPNLTSQTEEGSVQRMKERGALFHQTSRTFLDKGASEIWGDSQSRKE